MEDIAIQFENVGKLYHLGVVGTGTLSHDLNRWWSTKILRREDPYLKIGETNDRSQKGNSDFVWALKDITFDVNRGDVVGIIGKNGAGKSTLLKLLSRVTTPTTGVIRARGRLASLLEVGTGFHPELTGRENVYMNGSIMGMTKHEITSKLDEIVEFAGVRRYIDTPVKRYSSGMMVRLGFAVAAFLEPEILVVDEVLAVGDAEFQKKAIGKMQDVASGEGRTVLFVSHNMSSVRGLCNKGVLLENGMVKYTGTSADAIRLYLDGDHEADASEKIVDRINYKKSTLDIHSIEINGTENCETTIVANQPEMNITIKGHTSVDMTTDVMVIIYSKDEVPLASLAEGHYKGKLLKIPAGDFSISRTIKLPRYIAQGSYNIDLVMHHPMMEWQMKAQHCMSLDVEGGLDGAGYPLQCNTNGFIGLETIDD